MTASEFETILGGRIYPGNHSKQLLAVTGEMGTILARTSMSPIVYEVLDFACGITDANGAVVAQDNGLCLFTGTFQPQVASILEKFPPDIMRPGDVYMTNSPYGGGTHNPDIALIMPIFVEEITDRLRNLGDSLD